jgi:hypothetical protein
MKKFHGVLLGVGVFLLISMMGCASGEPLYQQAGSQDESVVVIQRQGGLKMKVYIDGKHQTSFGKGEETRIVVPNGEHTLFIKAGGGRKSASLPCSVDHEEVTFLASAKMGGIFGITVTQTGKQPLL